MIYIPIEQSDCYNESLVITVDNIDICNRDWKHLT